MARFREIDFRPTPMGDLILRERWDPTAQRDLLEIKLGDEFLMSSLFTVAEIALGHLATAACDGAGLDVVVGGLGLGCTALAVLDDHRVRSLVVVDALPEVIEWHREHLIPAGETLTADPRCRLLHGDFFAGLRDGGELDPDAPGRRWDAVIVDIDHTPSHHLDPSHADLYDEAGLARVVTRLHPGGVFALWSDDPPDDSFTQVLRTTFSDVRADVVPFDNPLTGGVSANTVYVARSPA
jgi:spermidine synthase